MTPRRLLRAARLTTCLTTLALLAACAPDVEPGADTARAAADDAGLLVALAGDEAGQDTATATLLVDWRDGTPRLGAATPGILVPRAGGYRWVGSVTTCTIGEGGDEWVGTRTFLYGDQSLWVVPADSATVTIDGTPCASLSRALYLARLEEKRVHDSLRAVTPDSLRPVWLGEEPSEVAETPVEIDDFCGIARRTVGFVDDTIIAYAYRSSTLEFCSPARYQTSGADVVRPLGEGDDSASIGLYALLPARARDSVRARFTGEQECAFTDSTGIDQLWAMRHEGGAWRVTAWLDGATVCRGGQEYLVDAPAPRAFAREAPLPMPMDSLSKRTGASDAATSPSGRWTVLLRGDSLVVARVTATRVDSAALAVPVPAPGARRIVMLRWLGAAEVARLRREMPALRRPVVRVRQGR